MRGRWIRDGLVRAQMAAATPLRMAVSPLLLGVAWALGCSLAALDAEDKAPPLTNQCGADADCGLNGYCAAGTCFASVGELHKIWIEVVPPVSGFYGAGDAFLLLVDNVSHKDLARIITLPAYATVKGYLKIEPSLLPAGSACEKALGPDGTMGVHVELTRSEAALGLPSATVAANATQAAAAAPWAFSLSAPPGDYDVYVTPLQDCPFPPVLLTAQKLEPGSQTLAVEFRAKKEISTLFGTVKQPSAATPPASLDGWRVELIESLWGRVVSTSRKLGASDPTNFDLQYGPLAADASPFLRLSPPEGLVAPSILWDLKVVDFDADGKVGLDLAQLGGSAGSLATVRLRARAEDQSSHKALSGALVKLRSTQLAAASGGLSASYEASAKTASDGSFDVSLLPGAYRAIVIPADSANAITEAKWEIAASPAEQAGRTLEVTGAWPLTGAIVEPVRGRPLEGIGVSVMPSTSEVPGVLERALGLAPVLPRRVSGATASGGAFSMAADPGIHDLVAQPAAASGFPWLVRARVKVPNEGLGTLRVSLPVAIEGKVRDPGGNLVQGAQLRVFALLQSGAGAAGGTSGPAGGAIQVAETRTDDFGRYRLLLPSSLR